MFISDTSRLRTFAVIHQRKLGTFTTATTSRCSPACSSRAARVRCRHWSGATAALGPERPQHGEAASPGHGGARHRVDRAQLPLEQGEPYPASASVQDMNYAVGGWSSTPALNPPGSRRPVGSIEAAGTWLFCSLMRKDFRSVGIDHEREIQRLFVPHVAYQEAGAYDECRAYCRRPVMRHLQSSRTDPTGALRPSS